ncbi:hypothetical protein ACLOJK_007189 [Asimina triloba]
MAALVGCVGSNGLLVGQAGFSPDLKWKKVAVNADEDGVVVDFKQMLLIATSRLIYCHQAAVDAMIGEKTQPELDAEAALLSGFPDRRRWRCWICATAWKVKEWLAMIEDDGDGQSLSS